MKLKVQFVPILAALLAVALLALNLGRSRQAGSAEAAAPSEEASVPFHHSDATSDLAHPTPTPTPTPEITVPAGTELEVCMQSSLSSSTASMGEHFEAVLQEPLVINGEVIAPNGTDVTGRVVAVRRSGRLHKPGYLRITLVSLNLKGQQMPLSTSSFFMQGASHKKRNWALIGGATGAGALIGALAGGGKGALIGSAAGVGAGTGAALVTGKKDITIGVERHLTFRLTQPLVTHS